ncbi:MAG: peptide chain release factor N(5)-glutamine methyltransferase [bacterium]
MMPDVHIEQDALMWMAWAENLFCSSGVPNPRVDAESIMASVLGMDRLALYLDPRTLKESERGIFFGLVKRRCSREPLQYILGEASFYGRSFHVTPDVLIPRPETELLVEACLERIGRPGRIMDVGTGSGCIAVTLACELPEARVLALDAEENALSVALSNARRHGVSERIRMICGDLAAAIRSGCRADLVVANLPYIPAAALDHLQIEVRDFEPVLALQGGEDGLLLIRRLIADLPRLLQPAGLAALEIGEDQGEAVESLFEETHSFGKVEIIKDLSGRNRMAFAVRTI